MTTLSLTEWRTQRGLALSPPLVALLRQDFGATVEPSTAGAELRWDVTPTGKVGAVRRGPDTVVVRPKLDIANVLYLLSVGSGADPWRDHDPRLAEAPDLTSAVGALFAALAQRALARGVLRGYRTDRADLMTVRGRIDIAEQLRRRPGRMLPLAVQFAEHDEDILENRLLLAATLALRPVVGHAPAVARSLHRLRALLFEVTPVHIHAGHVPDVEWTRLNAHYRPAVELARTILRRVSVDIGPGQTAALGLTLKMADVYEDFLFAALGRALERTGGRAEPQAPCFLDTDGEVRMRPDIVWYSAPTRPRAVIDAKYKRETASGPVDDDVYQLLAYCTALDLPDGHLVYAEGPAAARPVRVVHGGPTIHTHALDLAAKPAELMAQVGRLAERIRIASEGAAAHRLVEPAQVST